MRIYLECIPCFFNQALFAARQAGCSPGQQKALIDALALKIPEIDMESSPPENAVPIYKIIQEMIGKSDPFAEIKRLSNETALRFYPELVKRVKGSPDRLLTGVQIAVSGNIIDYGANIHINPDEEIRKILENEAEIIGHEDIRLFNLAGFRERFSASSEVLYIGDNAGEIVFDRVFIEVLKDLYPEIRIIYAVRGRPIINDVTLEDARVVGMDRICEVISSGSPAPGAIPHLCSEEFRELLDRSECIISKGQGNYEALSGSGYPVWYLLRVKCPTIAADIPASIGDICLFGEQDRVK